MRTLTLIFWLSGMSITLTSCIGSHGSGYSQLGPNLSSAGYGRSNRAPATFTAAIYKGVHRSRQKSWVAPDIKRARRLLFISDYYTQAVYIFTLPNLTLKGTLTGFYGPQGMCSDRTGNIWVANTGTQQILQYSRNGKLLRQLSDPDGSPVGCAINKLNGDLAVTNILNASRGHGGVEVYSNASGAPTFYTNPSQAEYYFDAYDSKGNLYVDGTATSVTFALSELPSGTSEMKTINLSGGTLYWPGGVNWYAPGNYLILGDQQCNGGQPIASCVYWVSIAGFSGTITGVTNLQSYNGGNGDVDEAVISPFGKYLAGGMLGTMGDGGPTANRWAYPDGGSPTHYSTESVMEPVGAAISNK